MNRLTLTIAAFLALFTFDPAAARAQATSPERAAVTAAAEALGGAARIRTLRNFTLVGYGQYAYQYGGGNITALPDAPMKLQAANDLRRVYDLENGACGCSNGAFLFPSPRTAP